MYMYTQWTSIYFFHHITQILPLSLGKVIPAVMLIGLGYLDCSMKPLAIVLLTLAVSLTGLQYSGFLVNHVDIAPPFAGILFGISNSMGSITGFVSPAVVGVITKEVGLKRC